LCIFIRDWGIDFTFLIWYLPFEYHVKNVIRYPVKFFKVFLGCELGRSCHFPYPLWRKFYVLMGCSSILNKLSFLNRLAKGKIFADEIICAVLLSAASLLMFCDDTRWC